MNSDVWHKVCEYLPHLQAVRLAEKRMSALEIAPPPKTAEKGIGATVLSVDAGVQALVEVAECSVQSSPVTVDQEISAVPGVGEASIEARPSSVETGVQVVPAFHEKSIGTIVVVENAGGSSTNAVPKSPEPITETVTPKETPTRQTTEPAPKTPFSIRVVRIFTFPIRLLSCSAKPVEDEEIPAEGTRSEKRAANDV